MRSSFRLVLSDICVLRLLPERFRAAAFADGSRDRTQFGRNISIAPGEEASDVTCFGCSIRVRGHVLVT